ncbi:MAG: hypothetical protein RR540_07170 [Oscillospiraceae bacterium]
MEKKYEFEPEYGETVLWEDENQKAEFPLKSKLIWILVSIVMLAISVGVAINLRGENLFGLYSAILFVLAVGIAFFNISAFKNKKNYGEKYYITNEDIVAYSPQNGNILRLKISEIVKLEVVETNGFQTIIFTIKGSDFGKVYFENINDVLQAKEVLSRASNYEIIMEKDEENPFPQSTLAEISILDIPEKTKKSLRSKKVYWQKTLKAPLNLAAFGGLFPNVLLFVFMLILAVRVSGATIVCVIFLIALTYAMIKKILAIPFSMVTYIITDKELCIYSPKSGKPYTKSYLPFDSSSRIDLGANAVTISSDYYKGGRTTFLAKNIRSVKKVELCGLNDVEIEEISGIFSEIMKRY